jgi:hypothetical protein
MKKLVHNVETGLIEEIDLTETELNEYEKEQAEGIQRQAEAQAKAQAKAALLERLGLTQEEFNTLTA